MNEQDKGEVMRIAKEEVVNFLYEQSVKNREIQEGENAEVERLRKMFSKGLIGSYCPFRFSH